MTAREKSRLGGAGALRGVVFPPRWRGAGGAGRAPASRHTRDRTARDRTVRAAGGPLIAGLDPLDQAQAAFELLIAGPAPLAVDGRAIGHRLPARSIRLD